MAKKKDRKDVEKKEGEETPDSTIPQLPNISDKEHTKERPNASVDIITTTIEYTDYGIIITPGELAVRPEGMSCWEFSYIIKKMRVIQIMTRLMLMYPHLIQSWRFRSEDPFFHNRWRTIQKMVEPAFTQEKHYVLAKNGFIEEDITLGFDVIIKVSPFGVANKVLLTREISALVIYNKGKFNQYTVPLARDKDKGSPFTDFVYASAEETAKRIEYTKELFGGMLVILSHGGDLRTTGPGAMGFRMFDEFFDFLELFQSSPFAKEKRRNLVKVGVGNKLSLGPFEDKDRENWIDPKKIVDELHEKILLVSKR